MKDSEGNSLLIVAAQHKAENVVHELIGLGVDVDTINAEGACALHFACYSTGDGDSYCPAIARALLNAGAC